MNRRAFTLTSLAAIAAAGPAVATERFTFPSIDGGDYDLAVWRGRPILVVNTASLCGFTDQYADLQRLQDTYQDRAIVLAVPSDDFAQELADNAAVAEFCEMQYGLTLPLTTIQSVRGPGAHPFYRWLARDHGFVPQWNFNKVLLDQAGQPVQTWGSGPNPMGRRIRGALDGLLAA
ncbi:glutathione peroxidase [Gymnodinialimonas sp. 2305UL16-5]|uniref:glutathione peroxidase n=1 Tax=Gymnodinialimonas mytili TaxID=3126503 RepID=UPI00309EA4AC